MIIINISHDANIVSHLSSEFFQFAAQSSVATSVSLRNLYRDDDDDNEDAVDDDDDDDDDDDNGDDDDCDNCDDGEDDYEDII